MDNVIGLYEPQTMLRALVQSPTPRRFLHQTFFGTVVTHTTPTVMLDVYKGKRRVARYTNPLHDGKVVEREGFSTIQTSPAYIKEVTTLRPQDLSYRSLGENMFNSMTPAQRAAQILGEDIAMLDQRIVRREEKMCAEALYTGKVIVKDTGLDASADFGYEVGKHIKVLVGDALWSNKTTSDPMKDLDEWRREIIQRTGLTPNICIVSPDVGWAIMDNAKIKERLNILNYTMGRVTPQNQPREGISYYGDLMLPSGVVSLYTYDEWYTDPDSGADIPMVPDGTVLLGSTEARCEFHYGLIQNMKSLQAVTRYPSSWEAPNGSARYVQLESAPMPNIFVPDAFIVANVMGV